MALCAAPLHAQPNLKRWLFAEGSTNAAFGFEQEILVANPNPVDANLTVRFFKQDGGAPIVCPATVPALSRGGINARGCVQNQLGVALEILSDVDIVAERSMYWGGGLFNFGAGYNAGAITDMRGGHNVLGVNAPLTTWSFAEGAAGGPFGFQTYVLVSNPSETDEAFVQSRYLTSDGLEVTESVALAPGQRHTFFANAALESTLGARPQYDFAIEVASLNSVPVVAERAMYWGPNLRGGHAATGVQPNSVWYFAEGVQGAAPINFDTYILLFNPLHEAIDVQVDFFGPTGLAKSVVKTLQPRTRENVWAGSYPNELAGADKAFSVRALNALGKQFVAERAVYWRGLREGTASAGTTAPARKWGFADGQEGGFLQFQNPADPDRRHFSTYYQVLNNTVNPVTVRGVFYLEAIPAAGIQSGMGAEQTIVVPALSRATFAPQSHFALHNKKFAAFFEASDEVIVERAVYWGPAIQAGHGSAGAVLPDSLPMLPPPSAPPGPTLTSISPNRGTPSGGTPVTINGANLGLINSPIGETEVFFGVTKVPIQNIIVNNANSISLVTPPSGQGFASLILRTRGAQLDLPGAFEFFDRNAAMGQPLARYNGTQGSEIPQVIGGFNLWGTLVNLAAARRFDLLNSCREYGQGGNNRFMFETVAEFRKLTGSNRWGLNWKRGAVGDLSQDIVTYFWGEEGESMRNSDKVFLIDMIFRHCGNNPEPAWFGQTFPTFENFRYPGNARWTTDPMCSDPRYRDMQHNGQYVFPECRD